MFGVLLASYAINAMDRQLFPLLAPEVRKEYGFSLAGVGFLSTVFTLGMAIAGLPTGYLLTRFSRKTALQVGIGLFSAATVLTSVSRGFADMLVYRAATGIGEAMQLTVLLAIATSYFADARAVAVGSINFFFAVGAIIGPVLGGSLLSSYGTWRVPMVTFGLIGFLAMIVIAMSVRSWFTETQQVPVPFDDRSSLDLARDDPKRVEGSGQPEQRRGLGQRDFGGASTLLNRNTIVLTFMSAIGGLVIYGYLGMYPSFLRESLHYPPATAGTVMSIYGLGALASIGGGWLGDRLSPRLTLGGTFLCAAALGYLLFHGSSAFAAQAGVSFMWGVVVSGIIYVNLASCHVKALQSDLASRASGIFVTTLYGSAAAAGYLMGSITGRGGWVAAGEIQICVLSLVAGALALLLRPERMS
jgi:predicted MFS family arabinose efflux permease